MNETNNHSEKSKWPPALVYMTGIFGLLYLLNPTAGVFEFIPDNLPVIGNLDEGAAALLIWNAFQQIRSGRKSV